MVSGCRHGRQNTIGSSIGSFSRTSSSSQTEFSEHFKTEKRQTRPFQWTNSLPRKNKRQPGEWNFYERTESCYDLTTLDFGFKTEEKGNQIVRTQSGLIVPPRLKKKSAGSECRSKHDKILSPAPPKRSDSKDVLKKTNLVRTQSGQIVPPRLKKSRSQQKVDTTSQKNDNKINESPKDPARNKIPPTPPKRKKTLQKEMFGKVFMNLIEVNGHCGMHVNITDQEEVEQKSNDQKESDLENKHSLITKTMPDGKGRPGKAADLKQFDQKASKTNWEESNMPPKKLENFEMTENFYQNERGKFDASNEEEKVSDLFWKQINSSMQLNYFMKNELSGSNYENAFQDNEKRESFYINEMDKEALQKCADSTYINDVRDESTENEIWETPRDSWKTTSDGYIEAFEIDNMNSYTGYSKIKKPKKNENLESLGAMDDDHVLITYHSEVTLSYNQVTKSVVVVLVLWQCKPSHWTPRICMSIAMEGRWGTIH